VIASIMALYWSISQPATSRAATGQEGTQAAALAGHRVHVGSLLDHSFFDLDIVHGDGS